MNTSTPILDKTWDVAVIGAGVGGGTLGHALAGRGHSVLFLERGYWQSPSRGAHEVTSDAQLHRGWWPEQMTHQSDDSTKTFQHPLGCGTGGSSGIFGMMMERFRPLDFTPGRFVPEPGDSTITDSWPISYDDLEPYYSVAEKLYRVRGTADPLFSDTSACLQPPAATIKEQVLLNTLSATGLHPYRFHYACERVESCNGCPGSICPRACRNDAHRICVSPAVEQLGADILNNCRVVRLESSGRRVREIVAEHDGKECRVRARIVVLAANAFASPLILLRSPGDNSQTSLANGSGMVGRNLMLHVSDSMLVGPSRGFDFWVRP